MNTDDIDLAIGDLFFDVFKLALAAFERANGRGLFDSTADERKFAAREIAQKASDMTHMMIRNKPYYLSLYGDLMRVSGWKEES